MVTLTGLLGRFVGWVTASRRRIVAAVTIPVLAVIALIGPSGKDLAETVGGQAGAGPSESAGGTGGAPLPTEPTPSTVTIGPSNSPRPDPQAPAEAVRVATDYAVTVNSHDARPGADRDFLDSYRRARPYVTAALYAQITEPSTRGDYQWATWRAQRATVSVRVERVGVTDGAPAPTATEANLRVTFVQVVTPQQGRPTTEAGSVALVTARQGDGRWLVSQLLAV